MSNLSQEIQRALLCVGYFPKEMPSVFTTMDFGVHSVSIISDWEDASVFRQKSSKDFAKIRGVKFRGKRGFSKIPSAEPETISKPKKLYERRNIHITHPIPQALLVREIAENWKVIQKWLSRQTFSEDEIVVSSEYDRAIKGINFQLHQAKTGFLEATTDWLVKTDITRFYPSLYTHSIAWAAYGKENVKGDLKTYEGSLADRLDLLVRSCNRNQTVGIPIGPETSRILAEIVSSRIDSDFLEENGKLSEKKGFFNRSMVDRLQDDWTLGASSLEEAENLLSSITKCYREYGLEINGSKTSVTHLQNYQVADWRSEISAFLSHRSGELFGVRLVEFLSLCLRLQLEFPSAPVLNYSLSIIEGRNFRVDDLDYVETFLLKAAAIAPISLDRICRIILNIEHSTGKISKARISSRFVDLAERHIKNGSMYEVIWLLYTIRGLKKPFFSKYINEVSETYPSSSLRLLLLDMNQLGLCIKTPPTSAWEAEISIERCLTDWTWLYAYEAVRKGWLKGPASFLKSPFIKPMHIRDVEFYDPNRNVTHSKKIKKISARKRKDNYLQVMQFMKNLRGFDQKFGIDPEY